MSSVSALEALKLHLLERWSSLLLHTFASMMADHATTEPARSEFIAFYVALGDEAFGAPAVVGGPPMMPANPRPGRR